MKQSKRAVRYLKREKRNKDINRKLLSGNNFKLYENISFLVPINKHIEVVNYETEQDRRINTKA